MGVVHGWQPVACQAQEALEDADHLVSSEQAVGRHELRVAGFQAPPL
jgi:hypothetical protein